MMTSDDISFAKEYREENKDLLGKEKPPCLGCSDETIARCSKLPPGKNVGCKKFKDYLKA